MNYTQTLLDYVYRTNYEDLTPVSIERAKERLIDSFGVIMAGKNALGVESLLDLLKSYGGAQESSVFMYGDKLPMIHAALINSIIMRSYDFEAVDAEADDNKTSPAHISGTTVPTALTVGEYKKCSGKELLRTLILADDVTARVVTASGFSVHDNFDNNGTANGFGATLAAGLLLGLTKEEMKEAFALAVSQMSGTMQNVFEKTMAFKVPIALSARNGIFSAQLAKAGYTSIDDPLAGPRGYFDCFCTVPQPDALFNHLGEKFYADCVIKPWCSCRGTHASINATLNTTGGKCIDSADIDHVVIHTTESNRLFVGVGFEFGMNKQYNGAFSIQYLCATAILHGDVHPSFFTEEMMLDPKMGDLLSKIEVVGDIDAKVNRWGAAVEIYLKDGSVLKGDTKMPKGDYYRTRMTREEILNKYYKNVAFSGSISKETADEIVKIIDDLENVEDISYLIGLLK